MPVSVRADIGSKGYSAKLTIHLVKMQLKLNILFSGTVTIFACSLDST